MIKNLKQFFFIAGLLLVAAGAQPAYTAVYQWSTTPANNATADPTINWSEGMSPSSVNDSARAMMTSIAKWRNDFGGKLTSAGTSTAYTLATNSVYDTFANLDGQELTFYAHVINGAAPSLNVDGLGARNIGIDINTAVPAGTLIAGSPYSVVFNNSLGIFLLKGVYANPLSIPIGGLLAYTGAVSPNSNFIFPAGQCISTTTYATYWALMGSPASGSCPGGQFAVIDLRGKVPAALDNLNGIAANLMTNSAAGCGTAFNTVGAVCANGNQSRSILAANVPAITSSNPAQFISVGTPGANVLRIAGLPVAQAPTVSTGSLWVAYSGTSDWSATTLSANNSISVTSTGTSGSAFPSVQPTMAVTYLLRVI